jgi:hypothetical protein
MIDKTATFNTLDDEKWLVKIVAISLLLELLMRYFRLPFFPLWLPFFFQVNGKLQIAPHFMFVYAIFSCLFLYVFFGATSLDFSLTFLFLVPVIYQQQNPLLNRFLKGWRLPVVLTPIWVVFSILFGNFPTGSISFEVFFTAISMRLVPVEEVAGILSRLLLLTLSYAIYPLSVYILNKATTGIRYNNG